MANPLSACPIERSEILISGFMQINNETSLHFISFAVLKAFLPTLNSSVVHSIRLIHPRLGGRSGQDSQLSYPSFIIRLISPDLVNMIMNPGRSYNHNYFTTKNLYLSLLSPETLSALPDSRIFINEVLSTSNQMEYLSIKVTAKRLGF